MAISDLHAYDLNPKRKGHHEQFTAPIAFEGQSPVCITQFEYPDDDRGNPISAAVYEPEEPHDARLIAELAPLIDAKVREQLNDSRRAMDARMTRAILFILKEIVEVENPKLTAVAIGYAVGVNLVSGKTQEDIAAQFKITKQAFSRRITDYAERWNLPALNGTREELARENMRRARNKNYAKLNCESKAG